MLLALLLAFVQADPAKLVDSLGSDRIQDREAAVRSLKDLGKAALPALQKAARSSDPELSERAKKVLRLIDIGSTLTPALRKAVPDAEERLDSGRAAESFCHIAGFDAQGFLRCPTLTSDDLETPARMALQEKEPSTAVLDAVDRWRLKTVAPRMRELLAAKHDAQIHLRAACILCRTLEPSDVPPLIRVVWTFGHLVGDTNALAHRARWTSLHAVAQWKGTPEAAGLVKKLKPFLTSKSSGWAEGAVRMLTVLDAQDAIPDLVPLIEERTPGEVRIASVQALSALGAKEQIGAVKGQLKYPWPNVAMEAARALLELGDPSAPDELVSIASRGRGYPQDMALEALSNVDPAKIPKSAEENAATLEILAGPGAAAVLAKRLESESPNDRMLAAKGIGFLQDPAGIPQLLKAMDDAKPEVRAAARNGLLRLRAREAIPKLKAGDKDDLDVLAKLGEKSALPAVRRLMQSANYSDRILACRYLAAIEGEKAEADLLTLLRDTDQYVRGQAAGSLADIGSPGAVAALKQVLATGGAYPRGMVSVGLCSLGVREAAPAAIEEMRWLFWQGWLLPLNALRSPDAWKKLGATPSKIDLSGTGTEILVRLAAEAGLTIQFDPPPLPEARHWLASRQARRTLIFTPPRPSASVRDVLESVLSYTPFDAILDGDKLRILDRLEAQRDWEQWEESTRAGK